MYSFAAYHLSGGCYPCQIWTKYVRSDSLLNLRSVSIQRIQTNEVRSKVIWKKKKLQLGSSRRRKKQYGLAKASLAKKLKAGIRNGIGLRYISQLRLRLQYKTASCWEKKRRRQIFVLFLWTEMHAGGAAVPGVLESCPCQRRQPRALTILSLIHI